MEKNKILVFGNLLSGEDNLALKILPKLRAVFSEILFKEFDSTEGLDKEGRNLRIIDIVKGIKKVKLIQLSSSKDFDKLEISKVYSIHDFDLAYNLKLLKKTNLIDTAEIIGIPSNISEQKALNQVQLILRKWVAQLMHGS